MPGSPGLDQIYPFDSEIPVSIYEDLTIDFAQIAAVL